MELNQNKNQNQFPTQPILPMQQSIIQKLKIDSLYFKEYKNTLNIYSDFHFNEKKELLALAENFMFDAYFQTNNHWGKIINNSNSHFNNDNINIALKDDLTKQTLEKLVKRNNGILTEIRFNVYEIVFNIENETRKILVDYSKSSFEYKIEKDNVPFIVDDCNYDYFLFLYLILNPHLIDENSFQYGVTLNDIYYIYLKKEIALKYFKNIVNNRINEEINDLIEYKIDVKNINGSFITKKTKATLFNAFETTDTKLHIPTTFLDVILLLNLDTEEEYNSLGFYFRRKDMVKGQSERQAIEITKLIAKKVGYIINKVGEFQISILYKNQIQITLSTNPRINEKIKNQYETILDIPFTIKVEIIKDRNSIMHETLLSKRFGIPAYPTGERTLVQVLELIEKIQEEDLDNVYVVLYNNKKDNSFYSNICYHTFEDALTMKDGFLDKTKDFEKIDLDMEKKLGKAYKYNEKTQSLFYCAIAKNVKLASFYADIIKKCEEHIYT